MDYFATRKKEIEKESFNSFENIPIEKLINDYSQFEANLIKDIKKNIKLFFMFNNL